MYFFLAKESIDITSYGQTEKEGSVRIYKKLNRLNDYRTEQRINKN